MDEIQMPQVDMVEAALLFNAPPPPRSILEALEQRLEKLESTLDQAKAENNRSKVRRMERIIKQYTSAVEDHKAGRRVDFDNLVQIPGFAPIPIHLQRTAPPAPPRRQAPRPPAEAQPQAVPAEKPAPQPVPSERPAPQPHTLPSPKHALKPAPINDEGKTSPREPVERKAQTLPDRAAQKKRELARQSSTVSKQLNYLMERQKLFREAALESKKKGDIQQAKEYLRKARGFDPLIEATVSGLPIDPTNIPCPPQIQDSFVMITDSDINNDDEPVEVAHEAEDLDQVEAQLNVLKADLQKQMDICRKNRERFQALGDVSTASKFEKLAGETRKDLDQLIINWKNGHQIPKFHYENRTFSIVMCNPDVAANELVLDIVKAMDLPGRADIDPFIKFTFPFPTENSPTGKTKVVKNSVNPVFDETFKFHIDRKSRSLPRVFKRHPIKLEVYSKGGFLRSDTLIGTASIKLSELETKCTLHDCFDLYEGRRTIGGKVEARVRIKEPLLSKQVEEIREKWLVFD